MLILIAIPALRVCAARKLLSMLIRIYNFSEITQTDREVDRVSWKLYTEMVSPIYSFFSSWSSNNVFNRSFVLPLSIW